MRAAALPVNDRHTYGLSPHAGAGRAGQWCEPFRDRNRDFQRSYRTLSESQICTGWANVDHRPDRPGGERDRCAGPVPHDHDDLNTHSAFLHVLGDTIASLGVIVAGILILLTGQQWIDPPGECVIKLANPAQRWPVAVENSAYPCGRHTGGDERIWRGRDHENR